MGIISALHRYGTQVFLIILFPENEESGSNILMSLYITPKQITLNQPMYAFFLEPTFTVN